MLGRVASQPRQDKNDLLASDAYFLKDFHQKFPEQKRYTYLSQEGYNSSLDFYLLKYRHEGDQITDKRDHQKAGDFNQLIGLKPGEVVLTCSPDLKARLVADYEVEELQNQHTCIAVKIKRKK